MIIHQKLKHLTQNQLNNLMSRYYDGENVKKLIKELDVNTHACTLSKLFPPIETNIKCPQCQQSFLSARSSKSI